MKTELAMRQNLIGYIKKNYLLFIGDDIKTETLNTQKRVLYMYGLYLQSLTLTEVPYSFCACRAYMLFLLHRL